MASILGVISLAIFVVFIVYLYRASKNTELWDTTPRTWTPGWTIGGWFIPIANFVIPALVVSDSWRRTPEPPPNPDYVRRNSTGHHLALVGAVRDRVRRQPARHRSRHVQRRSFARLDQHRGVDRARGVGGPAHRHRPHARVPPATHRVPVHTTGLTADARACGYHQLRACAVPASGDGRSPPPPESPVGSRRVQGTADSRRHLRVAARDPDGHLRADRAAGAITVGTALHLDDARTHRVAHLAHVARARAGVSVRASRSS